MRSGWVLVSFGDFLMKSEKKLQKVKENKFILLKHPFGSAQGRLRNEEARRKPVDS